MDAQEFTDLIENPSKVHDKDAAELKRLAHDYPYSQSVQLIYAMRLKNSGEHLFNQQLGRTSILTQDRSVLFDIFENGGFQYSEEIIEKEINESLKEEEYELVDPEKLHSPEEEVEMEEPERVFEIESEDQSPEQEESQTAEEQSPEVAEEQSRETSEEEAESVEAEEKVEKKEVEEEEDISSLPASERIKAILARSKRLQAEFEEKKGGSNTVNERVKAIRERFEKIKSNNTDSSELVPAKKEEAPEISQPSNVEEPQADNETEITNSIEVNMDEGVQSEVETIIDDAQESVETIEADAEDVDRAEVEEKEAPVFVIDEEPEGQNSSSSTSYQPISEDESHSFFDWFKRLPNQEDNQTNASVSQSLNFDQKIQLFDTFVEKLPDLKKKKSASSKSTAKVNVGQSESGTLVTETLAKVYISQGHFDKAMKAYQILKLKYPEKSSFFADRIQEIKNLKNSK